MREANHNEVNRAIRLGVKRCGLCGQLFETRGCSYCTETMIRADEVLQMAWTLFSLRRNLWLREDKV